MCAHVCVCICVGAGSVWVVQLRVEWLSEMTVINTLTLRPDDCSINLVY